MKHSYRGSIAVMTVEKLSLSFEKELAAAVRKQARADGVSVSAFVAAAVKRRLRREILRELVEEYQAEHGAFTEEEMAETRKLWPT